MTEPVFDKNSEAFSIYQKLKGMGVRDEELDQGYYEVDYSQPGPNEKRMGSDGRIQEEEVYEYLLDQYHKYIGIVEEVTGKPIPWVLDRDATRKIALALDKIDSILWEKGLSPRSPEYQEKMAVGLFYFTHFPDSIDIIQKNRSELLQLTRELEDIGLGGFRAMLFETGGLGTSLMKEDGTTVELTAMEALKKKTGWCTEKSKILFAVFRMAGLDPRFVRVSLKDIESTLDPTKITLPQSLRLREHVYIAVQLGETLRFFDLSIFNSNARYPNFYLLRLRHYLSIDRSNLGVSLLEEGRLEEALKTLKAATRFDRKNPGAYMNLANALYEQGHKEEAIINDKKAVVLDPGFAQAHCNLGRTLARLGKIEEAIASFQRAVEKDPKLAIAHAELGIAYGKLGNVEKAFEALTKAYDLDPTNEEIRQNLKEVKEERRKMNMWSQLFDDAVSSWTDKKFEKAAEQFQQMRKKIESELEDSDRVDVIKGALELKVKNMPLAMKREQSILKDLVATLRRVSGIYYGRSDFQKVILVCQMGLQLDPKAADIYWDLYKSYQLMGNKTEALSACLQYKKLTRQDIGCP